MYSIVTEINTSWNVENGLKMFVIIESVIIILRKVGQRGFLGNYPSWILDTKSKD